MSSLLAAAAMISVLFLTEVSAYSCENGWRYFPGTRSCYKLINDRNPWSVAELKCLYEGAHHTSISSYEENNFVHELSQYQEIWLGGAFFGQEYIYTWSDRTPYGLFEQWQAGYRPPVNRGRRCIKMDSYGSWFQSCCKQHAATVCKKDANPWGNNDLDNFRRF